MTVSRGASHEPCASPRRVVFGSVGRNYGTMSDSGDRLYGGVEIGERVYDEEGNELGSVRGLDRAGFYVLVGGHADELAPITDIRDITGTAYVMWRCWECGEMGKIEESLPEHCPNCGAAREELYYWAED